jgi:hypothetical protein
MCEIYLPRTRVNRGRNRSRLAAFQFAPIAKKRLHFVDERQQVLQGRVEHARAPPAETGLGRFVGLGGESIPRRPPSWIHGVWATRHDEVWVEALKLITDLGKPADCDLCVRTVPSQGSLERVGVDAVGFLVGDQDTHVAVTLTLVSEPPDGGEDLRKGDVFGEHLGGAGT